MASRLWGIAFSWAYLKFIQIWAVPEGAAASFKACSYADAGCAILTIILFLSGILKNKPSGDPVKGNSRQELI